MRKREIWLVDATTYFRILPFELQKIRDRYFRIESFARNRRFKSHPSRGVRTFSAGILQISSILLAAGYKVRYIPLDRFEETLIYTPRKEGPFCIGFGAVTPTVPICARLAKLAHHKFPTTRLILGGPHAMSAPKLTGYRYPIFNDIVTTRDESAATSLVSSKIVQLDAVRHAYELLPFPLNEYGLNLMTAVGCPFSCDYCQDRLIPRRTLSLDGGLKNIQSYLDAGKPIHFCDSVLGGTYHRALRVCSELEALEHGFLLSCDLRIEMITGRLITALERAGFVEIRVGLESADDSVLNRMNRAFLLDKLIHSLTTVRENSSLYISMYLVTGLPGANEATTDKNISTLGLLHKKDLVDQIKHHIYVPYPSDNCPNGDPRIKLRTEDWFEFDRNSHPVFELPFMSSVKLWETFIVIEKEINSLWLSSLGLTENLVSAFNQYDDYNTRVYMLQSGTNQV